MGTLIAAAQHTCSVLEEKQKLFFCTCSPQIPQVKLLSLCSVCKFSYTSSFVLFPPVQPHLLACASQVSYLLFTSFPLFILMYHGVVVTRMNLSPSVQTTIDRAGTFRKTNHHLLSLLGIECLCVYAHVHVYC